ncbi:MAG TPA: IS21 family transposase [Gammaproteobacteria bacterium]|nr:IS21 family transposase [Gammaproteobacteria bacterium]
MLDEATRTAILKLHEAGQGDRAIARALGVARSTVRRVIDSGSAEVPALKRAELPEPWREQILELIVRYQGHLGRVHEALAAQGATFSYPALTAFCRRHELAGTPRRPAGHYTFEAGKEMQHDTSPHQATIGGVLTPVQTASAVLCYSRMIFFQHYPRFSRFECKGFLAEALAYFGAVPEVCMIDNTHVVVAAGTGKDMVPAPEMAAFAARYGFTFKAHEKGHANRSARVEAPFHRIERAFLKGEPFADWADLNRRARETCETWNAKHSDKLHASRRELFLAEAPHLKPLPLHVPEVYQVFTRILDAEGYVHVNRIRYSAPYRLIGRTLEVRETLERVELYLGPRRVASHGRVNGPPDTRVTDPAHRPPRGQGRRPQPAPEEREMLQIEPRLADFLQGLKRHVGDRRGPLRRLLAMLKEYPREPFLAAIQSAAQYGLYDLERLEKMVLERIADEYFVLKLTPPQSPDE